MAAVEGPVALELHTDIDGHSILAATLEGLPEPRLELEESRLVQAISWLYDAVNALQHHSLKLDAEVNRVDGTLRACLGSGGLPGGAGQAETVPAGGVNESPPQGAAPLEQRVWRLEQQNYRHHKQSEQQRITDEKLLEMRFTVLQAEVDSRLQPKDAEDIRIYVNDRVELIEKQVARDATSLGGALQEEGASERKAMQHELESLSSKFNAHLELLGGLTKSTALKTHEELRTLEQRMRAVETGLVAGPDRPVEPVLSYDAAPVPFGRPAVAEPGGASHGEVGEASAQGVLRKHEERIRHLESFLARPAAANRSPDRDAEGAGEAGFAEDGLATPALSVPGEMIDDILRRLSALERGNSGAPPLPGLPPPLPGDLGMGPVGAAGGEVQKQLFDLHRGHSDLHQRLLELDRRTSQMEAAPPAPPRSLAGDSGAGSARGSHHGRGPGSQGAASITGEEVDDKVHGLKKEVNREIKTLKEQVQAAREATQRSTEELAKHRAALAAVTEYVAPADESDLFPSHGTPSSSRPMQRNRKDGDPLAWLEKRVEKLAKERMTKSLEARVQDLEAAAGFGPGSERGGVAGGVGGGVSHRLANLEDKLLRMDVNDLLKVRPQVDGFREEQNTFTSDMRQEMKELKCLVGCLEACVPRETRKAIELFKRAAGANNGEEKTPSTPRSFEVEGKILTLRDDMETRVGGAEVLVKDQCSRVSDLVRNMERQLNMLEHRIDDLKRTTVRSEPSAEPEPSGAEPLSRQQTPTRQLTPTRLEQPAPRGRNSNGGSKPPARGFRAGVAPSGWELKR